MANQQAPAQAEIGYVAVDPDIKLRRLVVQNPDAKGVVLFLHGFPETLHAWKDLALALGDEFEVHAFDWPGYGMSSRPPADRFSYSPKDYARVLKGYIQQAGIGGATLTVYATDIGALPALLLALEDPAFARTIIVGDFAPLNRPELMWGPLQALKAKPAADQVRDQMNRTSDEILENVFYRGVAERYDVSAELKADMAEGWSDGKMTSADAFYHYYSSFTRDQEALEADLAKLTVPVRVVWGAEDILIKPEMGQEFARRAGADLRLLPGVGHFPHLQAPAETLAEIRMATL